MSEETKQRIIEAGAELVHQRGFNNTGLKDILKAADVPKGSFYFYFDNKEAFGIDMVDHYGNRFKAVVNNIVSDQTKTPLEQLNAFFETFQGYFRSQGYTRGCPVGNLAQEMGDLSPAFRAKLEEAMNGIVSTFEGLLAKAQEAGEIPSDLDIHETATFIQEAWHGALTRMKVAKSEEPLTICHKFIFNKVLK